MTLLNDPWLMLIVVGIPAYSVLYVFAKFTYEVENRRFVVRWSILGFVPIYRRTFNLDSLLSVRRFRWPRDFFTLAAPLGNTFSAERAILEFDGWRRRSIAVTPPSYDALKRELTDTLRSDTTADR